MDGADLAHAHMRYVTLISANLSEAVLFSALLDHADFSYANMDGANLEEVRAHGAKFCCAVMRDARLWGALISSSDLRSVNLQSANLGECIFAQTTLRSADLACASNLTQQVVNAAWGDCSTVLPATLGRPDHWDVAELEHPFGPGSKYDAWIAKGAQAGKPL